MTRPEERRLANMRPPYYPDDVEWLIRLVKAEASRANTAEELLKVDTTFRGYTPIYPPAVEFWPAAATRCSL